MKKHTLLIVDDEKNIRRSVELICAGEGYAMHSAANSEEALKILERTAIDLIMLDISMPGTDGLTLLSQIHPKFPGIVKIMISGHATVENAVAATRQGAYDFIEKPIHKEKLLLAISNALKSRNLQQENVLLRAQIAGQQQMIGKSAAMQKIVEQIQRVAPTDGRVLILGESGTGKELIARAIHENSKRASAAFVKVNCAAIPEELIESELFGSVKGAFTGAIETRQGKFSQADGGTLFLDEVGDMSLKVQAKVLRALQEGEIEKVGGSKTERVDVRVIAATNKNLEDEIRAGRFREDLYFRLNVIPLISPPLRERRNDIPLLIEHFIESYCQENGFKRLSVSEHAMAALQAYAWPGNIRELKNIIERLVIMSGSACIEKNDLPANLLNIEAEASTFGWSEGRTLKEIRENAEQQAIQSALQKYHGNISQAAQALGIDRTNLHKKINLYKISPEKSF
ncbi:MAG: sigma-54-dependent Fis family transcriptional regulator [Deferribacteres bacterium]|nr:sigma-54-dependent Fis family transcriptional regulator [candidate division KSB1 bacterium]MCB9512085.1 sigma-54-dependent Fis family transcriptional regulator [Deferribacteres bacterium]